MRHSMAGLIAGAGFASGDRLVVGHWRTTPLGPERPAAGFGFSTA